MKPRDIINANKDEIIADYLAGKSTCEIGRKFNINNGSVFTFLKANKVEIRPTKVRATNKEKILELHHQGLSAYQINIKLGLKQHVAERALKDAGIDISHKQKGRKDKLTNYKNKIIKLYLAGVGAYTIGKLYKAHDSVIRSRLVAWGVKMRPLKRIAVDETFFDNIDSEKKAYCLGFIFGDGHNEKSKYSFTISITDLDILETIAQAVGYKGKIKLEKKRLKNRKQMYRLRISSKKMNEALVKLGCTHRKTYDGKFPEVDEALHHHLLRGWFDADGSIFKTQCGRWGANIVGNSDYCDKIIEILNVFEISTNKSFLTMNGETAHCTYSVVINNGEKNTNMLKFLDWLYKDSTIHLNRKYQRYLKFKAELAQ